MNKTEKIIVKNLLKIEIEKLCKKKNYIGLSEKQKEEYEIYCKLYKELGEEND